MDHTIRWIGRAVGAPTIKFTPTIKVTGKVTDGSGAPLKGGMVVFSGIGTAYGSSGTIKDDGSFTVSTFDEGDGAPAGEYHVSITDSVGRLRTVSFGNPASVRAGGGDLDFKVD